MRTLSNIILVLAALAGVLTLSVVSALRDQSRILDDFTAENRDRAHGVAVGLAAHLDALDQDARHLRDSVERSLMNTQEPETERRVWVSAFQALANVVAPYRTIALFDAAGNLDVRAVDPADDALTSTMLLDDSRALAKVMADGKARLSPAIHHGDRAFFLYGIPVKQGGALVVALDVALFLAPPQSESAPLFITDPDGTTWSECDAPQGCRALAPPDVPASVRDPAPPISHLKGGRGGWLGAAPVIRIVERVERPTGAWTVIELASSDAIVRREQSVLLRLLASALGAAIVVGAVGLLFLRQQRKVFVAESKLQHTRIVEDRTTIRDLENQLVRAEKLITVGVLSAGIAHEIGTPLAVIRGRAEQVRRRLDGASAEDMSVVIKHIDAISKTIRQLLDFSRRQPIEQEEVSLESTLQRVRELLRWKLEGKNLRLETAIDEAPPLAADPDQLEQVLVNLLMNACDASESGGVIRIVARAKTPKLVSLEIVDQGHGIAQEHLHAVFDPFFTTKKRGEGTGLGLSIVQSIVRNHGGTIDLSSVGKKGTTVSVVWPAALDKQGRS